MNISPFRPHNKRRIIRQWSRIPETFTADPLILPYPRSKIVRGLYSLRRDWYFKSSTRRAHRFCDDLFNRDWRRKNQFSSLWKYIGGCCVEMALMHGRRTQFFFMLITPHEKFSALRLVSSKFQRSSVCMYKHTKRNEIPSEFRIWSATFRRSPFSWANRASSRQIATRSLGQKIARPTTSPATRAGPGFVRKVATRRPTLSLSLFPLIGISAGRSGIARIYARLVGK